ncbi:MAG: metal-dependent hydrolase [bacterium]
MKGITHFASGVAAATFIPEIVRMSVSSRLDAATVGDSFIICLAGLFGVLPDTMDFKLGQFFSIAEYEIDPDPLDPDPQEMAETLGKAIEEAYRTGEEVRVQFFPIQLGANEWRQYVILFEEDEVAIQFNEIVTTSQLPLPGTEPPEEKRLGRYKLKEARLKGRTDDLDWLNRLIRWARQKIKGPDKAKGGLKPSTLDILSGTQFGFKRESDGLVYQNWLPWHRTWSHSYVLGALLTIPVFAIAYFLQLTNWWLYGVAALLGFAVHITEDMTGHIGGSLLWPLWQPRTEGFELFKASDPRTNFSIVYSAVVLIIWNLDRFSTHLIPMLDQTYFGFLPGDVPFLFIFLALPLIFYFWAVAEVKKRIKHGRELQAEDIPDGSGEPVID